MPPQFTNGPRSVRLVSDDIEDPERDAEIKKTSSKAASSKRKREEEEEIIREAIERFTLVSKAENKQRARELEDLKFARGLQEDHWPSEILNERKGSSADGVAVTARPCLVINKLDLPLQQILNEAKGAKLSIRIRPKAGSGTVAGATLRQKAVRAIEDDSQANIARYWALDRAAQCGRGYYRVLTEFANDGDMDQDITVAGMPNQASAYLDPYHKHPSGQDADWGFITDDVPRSEFKRKYNKTRMASLLATGDADSSDVLKTINDQAPEWITNDTVRVAEYFRAVYEPRERLFVPKSEDDSEGYQLFWKDELTDKAMIAELMAIPGIKTRTVHVRRIEWFVICATDILDREDWPGRFIPIIQVIGKAYNVNGDRCYKGIISNGKDAQRQYNYMRSGLVEQMALATKAPWVMAEGQDEGFADMWDHANVRNYSRLVYKPTSFDGHLVGPPQRNTAEPAIQAFVVAIGMADEDIKSTTGRHDASLGKYRANESGTAIRERQQQGEQSSSNYLDNLAQISMAYEGRVILDLLPAVYDRPGRIVRLLGEDKKEEFGMVGKPFVKGPDGMPQEAPPQPQGGLPPAGMPPPQGPPPGQPGMPPPQMGAAPPMPGQPAPPQGAPMGGPPGMPGQPAQPAPFVPKQKKPKLYTFSDGGEYLCSVAVGPSQQTEKDENARVLETLMEAVPAVAPMVAHIYAKQLDGPMGEELSLLLKKLGPAAQIEEGDEEDMAPEAQARVFALKQQVQQMMQAMQMLQGELEKKKYAVDAQVQMARELNQSREKVAQLQASVNQQIADAKGNVTLEQTQMKGQIDTTLQTMDAAHERMLVSMEAAVDAEKDSRQAQLGIQTEGVKAEHAAKADERKGQHAAQADQRKAQHAEAADTRKGQQAEAGDRRKGEMESHKDQRQASMASESDSRAAAADAAKDARAAADHAAMDARKAALAAEGDTRKAKLGSQATKEQHALGKDMATHTAKLTPKPAAKPKGKK